MFTTEITDVEILRSELHILKRDVMQDACDKDHWSKGRWPLIHALAARIREMAR